MSIESNIVPNANWFKGEDKVFGFTVRNSSKVVVDITGWGLEFTLWNRLEDTAPIVTKINSGMTPAVQINDPTAGHCIVTFTRDETLVYDASDYYYVLRRTDSGFNAELAFGLATLKEGH